LLGAAAYGLGNVARGAGVQRWSEPVVGSLVGAVVGLVGYCLISADRRTVLATVRDADPHGRALWLLSGVLTIGAQTCLVAATATIPVAVAVVVSAAVPVVVLPVGLLVRSRVEHVGPVAGLGVLFVTGGVVALVLG
jgi:drug/metabolite transporter (DMT)-like permease